MSFALDAEGHRDTAAACSAARTAEAAAKRTPEKAALLHPWGTAAATKARIASLAASSAADGALVVVKEAALAGENAQPAEFASRIAVVAATQADRHANDAQTAAFAIAQTGLVHGGGAAAIADGPPADGGKGKPHPRPLGPARIWE